MKSKKHKFPSHILFLLLLTSTLLLLTSCNTTEPQSNKKIILTAEDASSTEAWLNLKLENISLPIEIKLKQNDSTVIEANINSSDTTLFVENLLPNQTYTFQASSLFQRGTVFSTKLPVITMDTTSHNFTWETFILGNDGYSYLKDIAIINENNIWAVGEIHTEDTDKFDSNGVWVQPYNAVHWNGDEWELKRVKFYIDPFQPDAGKTSSPCESIFIFNENDFIISSNAQIAFFDSEGNYSVKKMGFKWEDLFTISTIWGTSSRDFYVVGNGGNIAHYNGNKWTKIESGTENIISDIWGFNNTKTAKNEVYFTIAGSKETISKITDISKVEEVKWKHTNAIETIWGLNEKLLLVAGEGIFKQKGNVWIKEELGKDVLVMDIKGENYNNIVSVGLNGDLNYYNGATWKTHNILDGNLGAVSVKGNIVATIGIYKNVIIIGKRN
ncbi:MAG: hypothetical protein L3J41_09505 [Melioribacteraceae bacterium]|nr:hypothetical protein [Melioribacteraceae bacterium]